MINEHLTITGSIGAICAGLDVFQIISEIEDELDITIDTDQNLKTVEDLVKYVESLEA